MSTNHKFYPFFEEDTDLYEKIREDMNGGPSLVFKQKSVVDPTYIHNLSNFRKTIVRIDASQLYSFLMCQEMPIVLCTRCVYESETDRFKLETTEQKSSRTWLCPFIKK